MNDLKQSHPEVAKQLRRHEAVGRPPLESQPDMVELHAGILDIVIPQSSADERRRTEVYNCCQSLDSLREKLAERGFIKHKSGLTEVARPDLYILWNLLPNTGGFEIAHCCVPNIACQ